MHIFMPFTMTNACWPPLVSSPRDPQNHQIFTMTVQKFPNFSRWHWVSLVHTNFPFFLADIESPFYSNFPFFLADIESHSYLNFPFFLAHITSPCTPISHFFSLTLNLPSRHHAYFMVVASISCNLHIIKMIFLPLRSLFNLLCKKHQTC